MPCRRHSQKFNLQPIASRRQIGQGRLTRPRLTGFERPFTFTEAMRTGRLLTFGSGRGRSRKLPCKCQTRDRHRDRAMHPPLRLPPTHRPPYNAPSDRLGIDTLDSRTCPGINPSVVILGDCLDLVAGQPVRCGPASDRQMISRRVVDPRNSAPTRPQPQMALTVLVDAANSTRRNAISSCKYLKFSISIARHSGAMQTDPNLSGVIFRK